MQALRTKIDTLIAGGSKAVRSTTSDSMILKGPGGRFTMLTTPAGELTRAGRVYQDRVGEPLPSGGYDVNQTPRRVGNVEFIKTRGGKDRAVRRWDPGSDKFVYTALGRGFYSRRRSEYVVQVPVNIRGKRENGTTYDNKGWMPISELGLGNIKLPQNLTEAQRDERIKLSVARYLSLDSPLYEVSQETWTYDPHGSWEIEELRTSPNVDPNEPPEVQVLHRTLGAQPASFRSSCIPTAYAPKPLWTTGTGSASRGRWPPF